MIEQDFWQHIKSNVPLVDGRVYANVIEQEAPKPAIVYMVQKEIVRGSCSSDNRYREWLLHIYAKEYLEAKEIKEQVVIALKSFAVNVQNIEVSDAFEEEAELFVQVIKFNTGKETL